VRQQDEHDLRVMLREEAERHRTDRGAMLDRIARGRAEHAVATKRGRVLFLLRPAAAAFAVAVLLVLGVVGVRVADRDPERDGTPLAAPTVVVPVTAAPAPSAPATEPVESPRASVSGGTTTRSRTPPSGWPGRDGFLSCTAAVDPHSNDGWAQGNVVLENTKAVTALQVTVDVAMTPGLVETGRWSTVPANLLTVVSSRKGDRLVFRFTLAKGAVLAPGSYTFAVQFNHAAGRRSAAGDTYAAVATGAGRDARVSGRFTAG
jgi:hypothetical protein